MKLPRTLEKLAALAGVQTAYRDVAGKRRTAQVEPLLAVLRALGVQITHVNQAETILGYVHFQRWLKPVEAVAVAWNGCGAKLPIRLPIDQPMLADAPYEVAAPRTMDCILDLEGGGQQRWQVEWAKLKLRERRRVESIEFELRELPIPDDLPLGYHRLTVEIGPRSYPATILSAPIQAQAMADAKTWGVFIPLYALRSKGNWGAGNYTDLAELAEWTAEQGGSIVGTLPLLPGFYEQPFDPSPYAPASRLLWNELYVDVTALPELADCKAARTLVGSEAVKQELRKLRNAKRVDYPPLFALQRRVLELLARHFFKHESPRHQSLAKWLKERPVIEDYACFRAAMEKQKGVWHTWPERPRGGDLQAGDYAVEAKQFYLYAQFAAHEQMNEATQRAKAAGSALYLDLPLGVHPDSYDAWRHQNLFAPQMSTGAPPDTSFPWGQNWGFAPLVPDKIRADGYRYVSAYIRHHMGNAGVLRIDHVMGLHRLFWVPVGMPSSDGIYVTYPAEELHAVLTLESQRTGCAIVGENLGTVPPYVGPAMARHGLARMYVLQYELDAMKGKKLRTPPRQSLASINTHDMPHFAGYWKGEDIRERLKLGLIDRQHAARERKRRQELLQMLSRFLKRFSDAARKRPDERTVYRAAVNWLGASAARITLLNLEDLWAETFAQNVPGTSTERPNWRGKTKKLLEEFSTDPKVISMLKNVMSQRR